MRASPTRLRTTLADRRAALLRVLGHLGVAHKGLFLSAVLTAATFFSGALSALADRSFFLSSTGDPEVVARLVHTFAVIQVGLGGSFLYVAFLAWRGTGGPWLAWKWSPDVIYAWVTLDVMLGLFCLNPVAVLLSFSAFGRFPAPEDPFEYAGRPGSVASLEAYRRGLCELAVSIRKVHPPQMILTGQTACAQCSLPNAEGRRRCRVCGTKLVTRRSVAA